MRPLCALYAPSMRSLQRKLSPVPCTGMKNINSIVPIGILARKLKVKSSWLRAEAEAGRLPHVKAGDTILFDPITIERVLLERARRKGAADERY